MVVTPISTRTAASEICAASAQAAHDADQRARQRGRQDAPAPVLAVDPERGGVLRHHDRQQNGGGLERRHGERQHRRRHLPGAGKAAFRQPERHHGGDGQRIEQGVGDEGHAIVLGIPGSLPTRRPAMTGIPTTNWAGRTCLKSKPRRGGLRQPWLHKSCLHLPAVPQSRPKCRGRREWTPAAAVITRLTRAGSAIRRASGARQRRRSTGSRSRRKSSTRTPASTAAGFRTASSTPAGTRSTATCSPAATTRPR